MSVVAVEAELAVEAGGDERGNLARGQLVRADGRRLADAGDAVAQREDLDLEDGHLRSFGIVADQFPVQAVLAPVHPDPLCKLLRVHLRNRDGQFRVGVLVAVYLVRDLEQFDVRVVLLELVGGRLVEVGVHRPLQADDAVQRIDEVQLKPLAVREDPQQ